MVSPSVQQSRCAQNRQRIQEVFGACFADYHWVPEHLQRSKEFLVLYKGYPLALVSESEVAGEKDAYLI